MALVLLADSRGIEKGEYKMEDLKYFKKVLKDFEKEIKEIQKAKSSEMVSAHSRAAHPLFVELQLAVPRLGNTIVETSRTRRKELAEGK